MATDLPPYDFQGDQFDLDSPRDRELVTFILSQALFGEATGVYCGKSLYAARSLEAAHFYVRQARQELNHLELFADIFRLLELDPVPGHWVVRLLSSHNNYYPLKVLMEHAIGEGMVHDIFKDVLLQTLPDADERVPPVKRMLDKVVQDEEEHVAWGEKETARIVRENPWMATPFYGLLEWQMLVAPRIAARFHDPDHAVLRHLPDFIEHVRQRMWKQGQRLGFVPEQRPGVAKRAWAMTAGALLYLRSKVARSRSVLEKTYIEELGFTDQPEKVAAK